MQTDIRFRFGPFDGQSVLETLPRGDEEVPGRQGVVGEAEAPEVESWLGKGIQAGDEAGDGV